MNYATLKKYDIANGLGVRVSLFVSGCTHQCKNCFNKEAWDFAYGDPFTETIADEIIDCLKQPYIQGLSLLGGEPLEPSNQMGLIKLLRRVKKEVPNKNIWCYTGYIFEKDIVTGRAHTEITNELLSYLDVLVDGPFIEEKKDITLKFRGSSNQRLIDVPKTLQNHKVLLIDLD